MISSVLSEKVLEIVKSSGGEFAEIFWENTIQNCIDVKSDIIDRVKQKYISGIGIRVIKNGKEFYTSTSNISPENILECANNLANAISGNIKCAQTKILLPSNRNHINSNIYVSKDNLMNKKKYAQEVRKFIKAFSPLVKQVDVSLFSSVQEIFVVNTNGVCAKDTRERSRISVRTVAEDGINVQSSDFNKGFTKQWGNIEQISPIEIGECCARDAIENLVAEDCPTGIMPIVIMGGIGGTFIHEACGHSLEASFVMEGSSEFADKLGEKIAAPMVTLIDDGTLEGGWGSGNIDDEGNECRKNILIKDGILKNFLVDYLNSRILEMPPTGNGRRENYTYMPTARMTNTFIAPGMDKEEDIIGSTDTGLLVKDIVGGSVNPITGEFNFGVTKGYLIKNGKIIRPVKNVSLTGKGSDILRKIDKIGEKLTIEQGMCGAKSGYIPVGVGQPMIRINGMLVGGH